MSFHKALLALLSTVAATLVCVTCTTNLTLTPAQVLLPYTSYYTASNSKEVLKIHVQVLLRVEPRVCVNWEVQNADLLRLLPPNNEENYFDYLSIPASGLVEGCSSSIWAASIPSVRPASTSTTGAPLRSWVFSYDASTKSRAGAEVIISPMKSIQFETRNRRITVNQIATLKIVGHDQFDNTFTSLEGIPFEARIDDPSIMQIIDPRNDPEVATRARISLLDRKDRFTVSPGYSLTSDVIVLQGKTVGRTKISVRVMLPEYKNIVLKDVEFTVSDSIDLEPSRVVLPPDSKFKFCVHKLKPQSSVDDLWDSKVNYHHYTWSTVGGAGQVIGADGTLSTGKSGGVDFRVTLTDKRNSEAFTSDVSVRVPSKLNLSYGGLQDMLECFATKGVEISHNHGMAEAKLLESLHQRVYSNCQGGIRCGVRYLAGGVNAKPLAYLLLGRSYIFDISMSDKDDIQMYVPEVSKFSWRVHEEGILTVTKSTNGRFAVVHAKKEGLAKVVIELPNPTISIEVSVSVTNPVHLVGFPVETLRWFDTHSGRHETITASTKPFVLPINQDARLVARGGSGEYEWSADDINMCAVKQGVLHCKAYGSTVLTLADKLNPENLFKVQVIVKRVKRLEFDPVNLHVEVATSAQLRLSAYADLSDITPVFSKSWGTKPGSNGQFYSCMPLNYSSEVGGRKLNCRLEYDQFMLDLSKVTEEPFACAIFSYRALHPGETPLSVSFMDDELIESGEVSGSARVVVYDRLSLSIHPDYIQLPFKTVPQPFMNVLQGTVDQSVFANVAIGSKIRMMVTGGPPMQQHLLTLSTCTPNSSHLYIEKVEPTKDISGFNRIMFDIYCVSETPGEKVCVNVDGVIRNEYTISCRLPSYVEIHPLVPVNNKSVHDNLLLYSGSRLHWEDDMPSGVFGTGASLCFKDDSKTFWQIKLNSEGYHAFRAVVFDTFGNSLSPSHTYKISWKGSALMGISKADDSSFQMIDNSIFIYKSSELVDRELEAYIEWADSFDSRHTSSKLVSVLKPRGVTSLIMSDKMWRKSPDRRSVYVLSASLKLLSTLPHEVLIGVNGSSVSDSEKRVSLFFNPKIRYQFAVVLGSGNYVELTAYSEQIKLQHSTTSTFGTVEDFSKAVSVMEGSTNLFDPMSVKKYLLRDGKVHTLPIPVKYMSFICTHTCSRSLDILDRGQLGQVTKTLIISQSHVSKLMIIVSEISDGEFEDFDSLSSLQGGLNLLSVKRQYRLHAVALDSNGIPMSYASLNDVKFSICSSTLVKLERPQNLGYKSIGNAMVIQCLAEGKYTIRAEIKNYKSMSEVADGSLITESLDITAYKETKPVLASILMLPNSCEFQLSMLESSLTRSLTTHTVVMESSNEDILTVVKSSQLGHIRSLGPGSCTLTSYIPSGNHFQSKSVTPVTVSIPSALSISAPTQLFSGKTTVLHADLRDSSGRLFTPVFLMGASESASHSFCIFNWNVNGHGIFVDGGENVPNVSGAGKSRVTLLATSPGSITVSLRASCRNLDVQPYTDLTSSKTHIDSIMPMSVFGLPALPQTILATDSVYGSKAGMVETLASVDKDVLTVVSKDVIKTEGKTGHVLIKTADNYVTHVQVRTIDQLHIHKGGLFPSEISVLKSGKKDVSVLLKTKDGQEIVPPTDLKLKTILSHASLFRVTTSGSTITLVANSSEGCSSLMVLLDDNDEQYSGGNLVVDFLRVCVSNALTPQHAAVLKGSSLRFMAGDSRLYSLQLRGIPLARRYFGLEHQSNLKYYQDSIQSVVDTIVGDLKNEMSRVLVKVFRDMNLSEDGADSVQFYMPHLEVSQYSGGLKPLYTFPFSVSRDFDSSIFMDKLTSLLSEFGRSRESVLSLVEGGVSPFFDREGSGWSADEPATIWVKDAQGVALNAGKAIVRFESPDMKGDSSIMVFDSVTKVELQHCAISAVLGDTFQNVLSHKETYSPFYIAVKATNDQGLVLKNTPQVDSKVMVVCEFSGSDMWLNEVFRFEPTFVPAGAAEFLPACRAYIRNFMDRYEWSALKTTLKNADESISGVKLRVSLHSTLPADYKSSSISASKCMSGVSTKPLWVTLRNSDLLLWERGFDWRVPMFAQFVDVKGTAIEDIFVEAGKAVSLSVYPHYAKCKLSVDNAHYQVRVTERQGLFCGFALDNDGVVEPANVKLVCHRRVIATLKVANSSMLNPEIRVIAEKDNQRSGHNFDLLLTVFTAIVAGAFAYLVYTLLHRPTTKYYETTEPIKIERKLPNVFEMLYQTDYHGSFAPTTTQYQHRSRS